MLPTQSVPSTRKINNKSLDFDINIISSDIGLGNVDNTSDSNKPVSTAQQTALDLKLNIASYGGLLPIASKTAVSGAALASTALTYASSVSLATHIPTLVVFKFASGTLGIGVAKIKNGGGDNTVTTALLSLISTQEISAQCNGIMLNSGNISVEVTTASLAASTFDVFVYGILRP